MQNECAFRYIPNVNKGILIYPRCFFYDLLVSPLHTAVSLKQIHSITMLIPKHLHLHMPKQQQQQQQLSSHIYQGRSCCTIWSAKIIFQFLNSQNRRAKFMYGVGPVTWGCPQTSPPAWRHRWMTWELLFWQILAAHEILLPSEQYAFPAQQTQTKQTKHDED